MNWTLLAIFGLSLLISAELLARRSFRNWNAKRQALEDLQRKNLFK